MKLKTRTFLNIAAAFLAALGQRAAATAEETPIFDAHIHYSEDAWETVTPEQAIGRLRESGVAGALVSSSNDDGTLALYEEAPDLVVPELRPYRTRGEISTWTRDETVLGYLESRLARGVYVAVGEFHVDGEDADLPVVRGVVDLARRHGLMLHAHSDADAVERLFRRDPGARILWAHAGFEEPRVVRDMMRAHATLWADLSFRYDVAPGGRLAEEWREVFLEFPDRFMVGTDTYTPSRWSEVGSHSAWARRWLAGLPEEVSARIAHENGAVLFGPRAPARESR